MADDKPTPDLPQFVNFDGRVTGETAQFLKEHAKELGTTPEALLAYALRAGLTGTGLGVPGRVESDVKVEPMTINAGNGGFHVLTFVTDGYGNLLTEDSNGRELAREPWDTPDDSAPDVAIFTRLAKASMPE